MQRSSILILAALLIGFSAVADDKELFRLEPEQITTGPKHHFFGYIGQCRTIPWNGSDRYVLAMEIEHIDRMPKPEEAATIILIDTENDNKVIRLDKTHAWNPQQGTMFYWNPLATDSQFFFNDRDVKTGKVFTVLYDIEKKKRLREYRFDDSPIGNGGVSQEGGEFLAINYGRLARLRPVTGYPDTLDWSKSENTPAIDGIFIVDVESGKRRMLVSYKQMAEKLRKKFPDIDEIALFINHTLWNRPGDRVYFFARAGWGGEKTEKRINMPFSIHADGTGLSMHDRHIGGHPEWGEGHTLIGRDGKKQIYYDVDTQKIVGQLGTSEIFKNPEGDISLSPDGKWFANGRKSDKSNKFTIMRLEDGAYGHSMGISRGAFSGDIRIDPAPRWNRANNAILVPGIAKDGTRQIFIIRAKKK